MTEKLQQKKIFLRTHFQLETLSITILGCFTCMHAFKTAKYLILKNNFNIFIQTEQTADMASQTTFQALKNYQRIYYAANYRKEIIVESEIQQKRKPLVKFKYSQHQYNGNWFCESKLSDSKKAKCHSEYFDLDIILKYSKCYRRI